MNQPIDKVKFLAQGDYFKRLVWDYNVTPTQYVDMIEDDQETPSYNQRWALARTLERADYYMAMKLIGKNRLKDVGHQLDPK